MMTPTEYAKLYGMTLEELMTSISHVGLVDWITVVFFFFLCLLSWSVQDAASKQYNKYEKICNVNPSEENKRGFRGAVITYWFFFICLAIIHIGFGYKVKFMYDAYSSPDEYAMTVIETRIRTVKEEGIY